jgi:hypothetical protein
VRAAGGHFLCVCKPGWHRLIEDDAGGAELHAHEVAGRRGRQETCLPLHLPYTWLPDVPLRDGRNARAVNGLPVESRDGRGKATYRNAFGPDLPVDRNNVAERAARTRGSGRRGPDGRRSGRAAVGAHAALPASYPTGALATGVSIGPGMACLPRLRPCPVWPSPDGRGAVRVSTRPAIPVLLVAPARSRDRSSLPRRPRWAVRSRGRPRRPAPATANGA